MQEPAATSEKEPLQEALEVTGAEVECSGRQVSLSRNKVIILTLTLDDERAAGLWATKLAVAGGNAESISKLFSIQRRRIQTLEESTEEAVVNNEQVERCLNFLSREYVQMRYEVRTAPVAQSGLRALAEPDVPELREVGETLVESVEEEELLDGMGMRHQSEPEKEPLELPTKEAATAVPSGYPSLLAQGQFGPSPRNMAVKQPIPEKTPTGGVKASRQLGRVLAEAPTSSPVPDREDRRKGRASLSSAAALQSAALNRQLDRKSVRTGALNTPNSR